MQPTNLHEQIVLPGHAAGKHLFVEKPLGFAARDGWRMAAAIEKAGVLFQTGYSVRRPQAHFPQGTDCQGNLRQDHAHSRQQLPQRGVGPMVR